MDSAVDELFIISDLDVSQNKLSLDQRLDWWQVFPFGLDIVTRYDRTAL